MLLVVEIDFEPIEDVLLGRVPVARRELALRHLLHFDIGVGLGVGASTPARSLLRTGGFFVAWHGGLAESRSRNEIRVGEVVEWVTGGEVMV